MEFGDHSLVMNGVRRNVCTVARIVTGDDLDGVAQLAEPK